MKIVTAAQMWQIDRDCTAAGTPVSVLMENAGKAVAEETRAFLGSLHTQHIICLIGGGNNGGDGLVAARYLQEWGARVTIYLCSRRQSDDPNLQLAREQGIDCIDAGDDNNFKVFNELLDSATCVIDALLGTGKMRPLEGVFKQVLESISATKQARRLVIVAVDLPSGLDADTGAVDAACPLADLTVTLAFPKSGLFIFPGAESVGKLIIADIGIPESMAASIKTGMLTAEWAGTMLPERPLNANKGSFGRVMVVAGSINYIGAPYLACNGAIRVGAGLVTLATAGSLQPILAAKLAEVTYLPLLESGPGLIAVEAIERLRPELSRYNVLLLGCGLGQDTATVDFMSSLIREKGLPPMIIDADAINIISRLPEWWHQLPGDAVLTPHPGEMARLCGLTIEEVQADRINIAVKYAGEWQKNVVLKGAHTVIAAADGRCLVSPFANPGLASAGTGDVLAGVITGLKAQGIPLFEAAALGVFIHGEAGETLRDKLGDTGMIASDLFSALPLTIKQLKNVG